MISGKYLWNETPSLFVQAQIVEHWWEHITQGGLNSYIVESKGSEIFSWSYISTSSHLLLQCTFRLDSHVTQDRWNAITLFMSHLTQIKSRMDSASPRANPNCSLTHLTQSTPILFILHYHLNLIRVTRMYCFTQIKSRMDSESPRVNPNCSLTYLFQSTPISFNLQSN